MPGFRCYVTGPGASVSARRTLIVPRLAYEIFCVIRTGNVHRVLKKKITAPAPGFSNQNSGGVFQTHVSGASTAAFPTTDTFILSSRTVHTGSVTRSIRHSNCGGGGNESVNLSFDVTRQLVSVPVPRLTTPDLSTAGWTELLAKEIISLAKANILRPSAYTELGHMIAGSLNGKRF